MFEFYEYLTRGGLLMVPIGICSLLFLAITLERYLVLRRTKIVPLELVDEVRELLAEGRTDEAFARCGDSPAPLARVIEAGIRQVGAAPSVIRESMETAGRQEALVLERYLPALATIASITPLLGLLGTVTGMIRVFDVITRQGVGDPTALSGGISEALLTTAAGLVVAIPTLVVHNALHRRLRGIILEIEGIAAELARIIENVANKAATVRIDTWRIRRETAGDES